MVLAELEAPLRALGFAPRRTRADPAAVLWTRGQPRLALSGHVDVVPAGEGWARDPRGGEVAEDRVWGRGACDMLGSIACFVGAATRARAAPCGILLTTDEETRMRAAEVALSERLLQGFEAIVVGEPTSFDVGIAEKGVLWLRVTTKGRNAHGSMPHLGDNAAERLVRALVAVQQVEVPGEHALLGRGTRNLGRIQGGEAVNQVPASATAEIDIRYLPGTAKDALISRYQRAIEAAGEVATIDVLSDHAPFETPADGALARAALEAAQAERPGARALGLPYGTEASKFAPAGIPCVILGPGEQDLAHTSRESVSLADLAAAERTYARLLERYA